MYRHTRLGLLAAAVVALGATALAAQAAHDNDALPIQQAKISLSQAVAAAEQHVHGLASRAEFERDQKGWVYDVEVVQGVKVFDVKVDANQGGVISTTEDRLDRDDEHDEQD